MTSTVLNVMEAGDHEQQEFLDRSVFSDALRAMRMDYNAARSAAAQSNWKGSTGWKPMVYRRTALQL